MKKYLVFSFDDGTTQDLRLISLLKKFHLTATFNLNTGLLGLSTDLSSLGISANHIRLSAEQIRAGVYGGFECSVHTLTHPLLTSLSDGEVIRQINTDAENIFSLTGRRPNGMAYPGGGKDSFDDRTVELLKLNTDIKYARVGETTGRFDFPDDFYRWKATCSISDPALLTLCDKFLKEDKGLFFVWGHSFELDEGNLWGDFERLLSVTSEQNDICCVSCGQMYDILTAKAAD